MLLAPGPAVTCVEQCFEDKELQVFCQENDEALGGWPPVNVVEVGQEDVVILPLPRAGKVVVMPDVKDVILKLLYTLLQEAEYMYELLLMSSFSTKLDQCENHQSSKL